MSSVIISGDTSGAITLAAPSVAGTNTITLPASTGTVLTTGSPQSGGVIQVVNSAFTTSVSTTSASFVAVSGFSASITPKFSTSKILVLITAQTQSTTTNSNFTIYRNGSTNLGDATTGFGYFTGGGGNINIMASFSYQDSPATTSATTYALYYKTGGGQTLAVNNGAAVSSITLMEIAA